ncbi:hypothetical protein K227x_14370 [Rubripirellula lacrimiformis]|uniref:DUF2007 domain-containing protein n=1 Tax=Rubripirellula lacrimiformis TaxID=1930273 RepID=A0A517N7S7_9BACT|nr:hypothetical protein [Rubripirellula lacrimiformis]QDT03058.1 hypothetical protein K227x_14370 [Rubripirellula lacrimiformis]
MTLPETTVVYRSRDFQDAEAFAAHLVQAGINARLVSPRQVGHVGEGPVFDTLHDVLASDCTEPQVRELLSDWRSRENNDANTLSPFCYHCGFDLEAVSPTCPDCGKTLDFGGD